MSQSLTVEPFERTSSWSRCVRDLTLLIGLTLALHLPFIGQAFHLDDAQYLDIARNVYRNPLFPLDLPIVFEGLHYNFSGHSHPPLNSYLIAALLLFHHRSPSEVFLHTAFLFFPLLVSIAFYFLSMRFVRSPLLASTLLATNPTLMVSAHTLMADVPLLAFWLAGAALFLRGVDRNKPSLLYAAGLPLTAACFYAYQGLALIPLLAFYALSRKRMHKHEIAVLCIPILLMAGWQFSGYFHRGITYVSTMFGYLGVRGYWQGSAKIRTTVATLTYLGGTILPFPFIWARTSRVWNGLFTAIGLAVAFWVVYARFADYTWFEQILFVACFGGGVTAFLWVVSGGLRSCSIEKWAADNPFLCVWFAGMLLGCVLAFYSGSARYLLPACPPLLLFLIRSDEERLGTLKGTRLFYAGLIGVQLVVGFFMTESDYEFARIGQLEAHYFQERYLSKPQPFLVSGEWGFRYYLTAIGGETLARDTTASPGELIIKSRLCLGLPFDDEFSRSLEQLEQRTYRIGSPIRLLDEHSRAGFWSDGWGVLPFSFSREKFDDLYIYRVMETAIKK
jgi:4-amino-4-deoxy-L-arabinose transferase-like glycosyltransferase